MLVLHLLINQGVNPNILYRTWSDYSSSLLNRANNQFITYTIRLKSLRKESIVAYYNLISIIYPIYVSKLPQWMNRTFWFLIRLGVCKPSMLLDNTEISERRYGNKPRICHAHKQSNGMTVATKYVVQDMFQTLIVNKWIHGCTALINYCRKIHK